MLILQRLDGTNGVAVGGRNNVTLANALANDGVRFRPDTSNVICSWTSDVGPGMLQDSTALNATSIPLTAANSMVCFFAEVTNGSCTLRDTVCVQVGALPINNINLQANVLDREVMLTWEMPVGDNYDRFIVEYASQGEGFVPLGQLSAAGLQKFSFLHGDPADGLNRYRLRVIDADGTYQNSNVVEAFIGELEDHLVSVYPNPGTGEFTLSYHLTDPSKVEIQVADLQGRVFYTRTVTQESAGSYSMPLDLTKLGTGVYLYQLRINGKRVAGKIQINR